jgi:hypothetical protein
LNQNELRRKIMEEKINYIQKKNGEIKPGRGYKTLCFSPDYKLRPVIYAVYSGNTNDRGTVQGCLCGDYLCSCYWNNNKVTYAVCRVISGGTEKVSKCVEYQVWSKVKENYKTLIDVWLEPYLNINSLN